MGGGFAFPTLTPVVKHLLLANGVAFLVTFALSFDRGVAGFVVRWLGLDPSNWKEYAPLVPFWQLLSYGFLHDLSGLGHLLFNMLSLYFFGTMLEGIVGSRRFLRTYLAAIVVGGLAHLMAAFITEQMNPAVGASGGVLGVIVACAVLRPNTMVIVIMFPVRLKWVAGFIVGMDIFSVLVGLRDQTGSGVAHWVHLAGAGFGFLMAWRKWIWADPMEVLETRRLRLRAERDQAVDLKMDDLLVKIKKEGLGALSKREKDFLKRASQRKR